MKKLNLSLTVAILFVVTSITAQNFNNASEYLDFVGEEQQEITLANNHLKGKKQEITTHNNKRLQAPNDV